MNCTNYPAICAILRAKIDGTFLSKANPLPPLPNISTHIFQIPPSHVISNQPTPTSTTELWLVATTCVALGAVVVYQLGKYGNRQLHT